jgi:GNAT superfamily N-acetyltransferase
MPFATWWRGDSFPELSPLSGLSVRSSTDTQMVIDLTSLTSKQIETRFRAGHRLYLAFLNGIPAAYGWVATREGGISEFRFSFPISNQTCYLWDFLTLPEWRGRGLYPRLIRAIVQQESHIERFWIGYAPGNDASQRGIQKAGFRIVSDLIITDNNQIIGITLFDDSRQARASADFLHLPVVKDNSEWGH